jgi:hypothetical protein
MVRRALMHGETVGTGFAYKAKLECYIMQRGWNHIFVLDLKYKLFENMSFYSPGRKQRFLVLLFRYSSGDAGKYILVDVNSFFRLWGHWECQATISIECT